MVSRQKRAALDSETENVETVNKDWDKEEAGRESHINDPRWKFRKSHSQQSQSNMSEGVKEERIYPSRVTSSEFTSSFYRQRCGR